MHRIGIALCVLPLIGAGDRPNGVDKRVHVLVPAYFYPSGEGLKHWDAAIAAAKSAPITMVVNPASGPGERIDPNYTAVLGRAKRGGVRLVGYISTRYAKRPLEDVKTDIDRFARFYPEIEGFHFDEQNSGAGFVDYYEALYRFARRTVPKAVVYSNPGTTCEEAFVARPTSEVVCLYERDRPLSEFRMPEWTGKYPPDRFSVILHQVRTEEDMKRVLNDAVRMGFGHVFISDATGVNPYDRLPSYWRAEIDAVRAINRPAAEPRR